MNGQENSTLYTSVFSKFKKEYDIKNELKLIETEESKQQLDIDPINLNSALILATVQKNKNEIIKKLI